MLVFLRKRSKENGKERAKHYVNSKSTTNFSAVLSLLRKGRQTRLSRSQAKQAKLVGKMKHA